MDPHCVESVVSLHTPILLTINYHLFFSCSMLHVSLLITNNYHLFFFCSKLAVNFSEKFVANIPSLSSKTLFIRVLTFLHDNRLKTAMINSRNIKHDIFRFYIISSWKFVQTRRSTSSAVRNVNIVHNFQVILGAGTKNNNISFNNFFLPKDLTIFFK